jgi:hypothetical protein
MVLLVSLSGCARSLDPTPARSTGASGSEAIGVSEPVDAGATISRETALDIAFREEGRPDADSVSTSLRLMRVYEQGPARLVWVVTYEGVCVRGHGPPQAPDRDGCVSSRYGVVIDATTGAFLVAGA